jgi:heme/copper-type cytochrome/quinol oxidase subunit 2
MNEQLLPVVVWMQVAYCSARTQLLDAWEHRHDEDGVDEAVTKMIWLAVGIVVAIAATAFFMTKFNQAKDNVPDPVAP